MFIHLRARDILGDVVLSTFRGKRMIWILGTATVVFLLAAIWLANEHVKKFRMMADFMAGADNLVTYRYAGPSVTGGAGMRNVVLRGRKPFSALVGFRFTVPLAGDLGSDFYGIVRSNEHGVAVISTYLGHRPADFLFLLNSDLTSNPVIASSTDTDQDMKPHVVFPPHLVQRLGF